MTRYALLYSPAIRFGPTPLASLKESAIEQGFFKKKCIFAHNFREQSMSKTNQDKQKEPLMASEPAVVYGVRDVSYGTKASVVSNNSVLDNTMSVDDYFDELISLVHKDYANL